MTETSLPILAIDFDGVIHDYQAPWKGAHVVDGAPIAGAMKALVEFVDHFDVHIFSSRSSDPKGIEAMKLAIGGWIVDYFYFERDLPFEEALEKKPHVMRRLSWPTTKPPALIFLDDRAMTFDGNWDDFPLQRLKDFRAWNR